MTTFSFSRRTTKSKAPDLSLVAASLLAQVAVEYLTTANMIQSRSRAPHVLLARRVCIRRLRDELSLPWKRIGDILRRDHATVYHIYHGHQKVKT